MSIGSQGWEKRLQPFGDEEEILECPYNKAHIVRRGKMGMHLLKCRGRYEIDQGQELQMRSCTYDLEHLYPDAEILWHERHWCDDYCRMTTYLMRPVCGQNGKPVNWHGEEVEEGDPYAYSGREYEMCQNPKPINWQGEEVEEGDPYAYSDGGRSYEIYQKVGGPSHLKLMERKFGESETIWKEMTPMPGSVMEDMTRLVLFPNSRSQVYSTENGPIKIQIYGKMAELISNEELCRRNQPQGTSIKEPTVVEPVAVAGGEEWVEQTGVPYVWNLFLDQPKFFLMSKKERQRVRRAKALAYSLLQRAREVAERNGVLSYYLVNPAPTPPVSIIAETEVVEVESDEEKAEVKDNTDAIMEQEEEKRENEEEEKNREYGKDFLY